MIKLSDYDINPIESEPEAKTGTRRFKAAKTDRVHNKWGRHSNVTNYDLRSDLSTLRARSRSFARNNSLGRKFFGLVQSNIVGPKGIQLQVNARTPRGKMNTNLNKQIETEFWKWGFAETCSASGKLNWIAFQNLVIKHLSRDGEALIQLVKSNNKYGLSLKVIPVEYLDEQYTDTKNGNRIVMSIEVDNDWKPVAYWLTTPVSNMMFANDQERRRVRVPADQIIHAFIVAEDEEQVRGIPWTHATMVSALFLSRLDDSVLLNVTNAANTLGFIKNSIPDENANEWTGEEGEPPPLYVNRDPMSFTELDAGQDIQKFSSEQPHQNLTEYAKRIETSGIAAGLDVPYFELTGDLSEVNFSSARIGLAQSRDNWRGLQGWFAEAVCLPIYKAWVKSAIGINGILNISPRDYDEIQMPEWQGRRWEYIEPLKDAQADALAIATGTRTLKGILAERGIDFDDHVAELVEVKTILEEKGLDFTTKSTKPGVDTPDDTEDDPKPSDTKKKTKTKE